MLLLGVLPWTEQPNERLYSPVYSRHLLETERKGAGRDIETSLDGPVPCPRAGSAIPREEQHDTESPVDRPHSDPGSSRHTSPSL